MDAADLDSIIKFLQKAEGLKDALRSAYTGTGRKESAAEHSWRLSLLALLLGGRFKGANLEKMLKLCIVHDLAEAVCGDIPAPEQEGLAECEKSTLEREAMRELCAVLPEAERAEIFTLWEEYESCATPEARLIKAMDKLETLIQHNQGVNNGEIRYDFNLGYGQKYMDCHPLIRQLRDMVDRDTALNAEKQKRG